MPAAVKAGGVYADKAGVFLKAAGIYAAIAGALWTPNANAGVVSWLDSTTLADGTVASWVGSDPYTTTYTATGTINKASDGVAFTGTQYMTRPSNAPAKLRAAIAYPESIGSGPGTGVGPTCTGLCKTSTPNRYICAIHGYYAESGTGSPGVSQSQMRLAVVDLDPITYAMTVFKVIDLMTLLGLSGLTTYSAQGVAFNSVTGFAHVGVIGLGKIVCVDVFAGANGTLVPARDITPAFTPTSCCIDTADQRIWILEQAASGDTVFRECAHSLTDNSQVVAPFTTNLGSQDSSFYRDADRTKYTSGGGNGVDGYVRCYYAPAAAAPKVIGTMTFPGADAIEGVVLEEATGRMLVNNDAGYHIGGGRKNELLVYDLPPLTSSKAEMVWVGQMTSVAAAKGIWLCGDPLNGGSQGFGMNAGSATTVQLIANTGASGLTQRSLYTFTVPSLVTAARILVAQWDQVAGTCRLWCDGTEITGPTVGAAMSTLVGPMTMMSSWIIANSLDNLTRQMVGRTLQLYGAFGTLSDPDKASGWAAWKTGLVASLPGGHPYKTAAPGI